MLVVMADESLAIRQLLQQALGMTSGKPAVETVLHEFGRCRYLVQLERGPPRLALLSFATGQSLPDNYRQVVQEAFKGIADITATVEGYQLTLRVILEVLTGATHVEQQLALSKLSSLRKVVMAAGVRKLLLRLGGDTLVSEPTQMAAALTGQPIFLKADSHRLHVVFPLQHSGDDNSLLSLAFIQALTEVQSRADLKRAPQYSLSHPGVRSCISSNSKWQAVCPVTLSSAQRAAAKCATAGYLTMTVLPQHVATPERADQLAWTLLTFYAFMAQHATSFKAHLHVQMRRQADNMLRELDQARVHPGTQQRTAATRTPVRLASRAKVDSLGIEFTTPLPVKLSFAAAV